MTVGRPITGCKGMPPARKRLATPRQLFLPNEIWIYALGYLRKAELQSVRLVGDRHLNELASLLLFHTAYVAARSQVLHIFMQMSSHPQIRHYIKEVVYDCPLLERPRLPVKELMGVSQRTRSQKLYECPLIHAYLDQHCIQIREISRSFRTALNSLTNVKKVTYIDLSPTADLPGNSPDAEAQPLSNQILYQSCCDYAWKCFRKFSSQHESQYNPSALLIPILSTYSTPTFSELELGTGVHEADMFRNKDGIPAPIWVNPSAYGGIPNWVFDLPFGHELISAWEQIFRRLRNLNLTISYPHKSVLVDRFDNRDTAVSKPGFTTLGGFLSVADDLEESILRGHVRTMNFDLAATSNRGKTWRKLRVLYLEFVTTDYLESCDILFRHRDTLQRPTLHYINLPSDSSTAYQSLVDFLNANMALTSFGLGCTWLNGRQEKEYTVFIKSKPENEQEASDGTETSSDEDELEYDSGSDGLDDEGLGAES